MTKYLIPRSYRRKSLLYFSFCSGCSPQSVGPSRTAWQRRNSSWHHNQEAESENKRKGERWTRPGHMPRDHLLQPAFTFQIMFNCKRTCGPKWHHGPWMGSVTFQEPYHTSLLLLLLLPFEMSFYHLQLLPDFF